MSGKSNKKTTTDLLELQQEHKEWYSKNFSESIEEQAKHCLYGVAEEVGELMHAIRCQEQGIRGDRNTHEYNAEDAVGDIVIFLIGLCNARGWNMHEIIRDTWQHVKLRNWNKNKINGMPGDKWVKRWNKIWKNLTDG
jgi:NTP pyrophosphatase (non-canonical NTP hydrolase)